MNLIRCFPEAGASIQTVTLGDVTVCDGDYVIADRDGVVVVDLSLAQIAALVRRQVDGTPVR